MSAAKNKNRSSALRTKLVADLIGEWNTNLDNSKIRCKIDQINFDHGNFSK